MTNEYQRVCLDIPKELYKEIKHLAIEQETTAKQIINNALSKQIGGK